MKKAFSLLEMVVAFSLFFMAFLPFLSFQKSMFQFLRREERIAEEQEEFYKAVLSFPLYEDEAKLYRKKYYHREQQWTEEREGALWQGLGEETRDRASYRILIQSMEGETLWETWISKERWLDEKESFFSLGV